MTTKTDAEIIAEVREHIGCARCGAIYSGHVTICDRLEAANQREAELKTELAAEIVNHAATAENAGMEIAALKAERLKPIDDAIRFCQKITNDYPSDLQSAALWAEVFLTEIRAKYEGEK